MDPLKGAPMLNTSQRLAKKIFANFFLFFLKKRLTFNQRCAIIKSQGTESSQRKGEKVMRNWRVWVLVDKDGKEIARGRKKDVVMASYHRYVYRHIFTDVLYRTNELL